jgi:hypothetical protein
MTTKEKLTAPSRRVVLLALAVGILAACTGCMMALKFSFNPGPPPAPTLRCPVALEMSKEFANNLYLSRSVFKAPFGPALQKYAIFVAQSVFGDVQVLDGQPPRSDVKLLLVPRVASINLQVEPPGAGDMAVVWDFKDPKTGQTLLGMRLQCEFTQPHVFTMNALHRMNYVVDGLMTNLTSITIQRFNASKDLQSLSGH